MGFHERSTTTWNGFDEETACAKTIQELKVKLDNKHYGDITARA